MDESGFRNWLAVSGVRSKLASDTVCRVRRTVRILDCDIDEEYLIDEGKRLLSLFDKQGQNDAMKRISNQDAFPIGKNSIAAYKAALRKYFAYKHNS